MTSTYAIVGSRTFTDYRLLCAELEKIIDRYGYPDQVVSGGAIGTDTLARKWADEHNIPIHEEKPKYTSNFDRQAPLRRNTLIVERATLVIAFVNSDSRGTWDTIKKAHASRKECIIIRV